MNASTDIALAPFTIGSRFSVRNSFDTGVKNLAVGASTPLGPIQVPAVGFLGGLLLHVTTTAVGATGLNGDAPFNIINEIQFRNSKGDTLIAPISGYSLYLLNKYGGGNTFGEGQTNDPRAGAFTSSNTGADFFLWLPLSFDQATALGAIPATASNNNYQVDITFNSLTNTYTAATAGTAQIRAQAFYWDIPNDAKFANTPPALGTASIWNREMPTVGAGEKLVQSFNTGNIIRNHILVLRDSSGVRTDAAFPDIVTLVVDNVERFRLPRKEWEFLLQRWYGYTQTAKDVVGGLDTGVYVFPYHLLSGGLAGDPANFRDQLLQTETTTLLQFRAQQFGSAAAQLEILTQAITTKDINALYNKG